MTRNEKIWLDSYPKGMPEFIDPDAYSSVADFFETCCEKYASLTAYSNMGVEMTYAEVDAKSRDFAAWLQAQPGLEKGDRVALMMPNMLPYPIALFGVLRAGLVAVTTNPLYSSRELHHQLSDSGAKAIIIVWFTPAKIVGRDRGI